MVTVIQRVTMEPASHSSIRELLAAPDPSSQAGRRQKTTQAKFTKILCLLFGILKTILTH